MNDSSAFSTSGASGASGSFGVFDVLIVDDDMRVARINAAYVAKVPGFRVSAQAHSAAEALALLDSHPVDLILLDHYLPDENGLDLVRRLRERGHRTDVIMVTAARDLATVQAAMRLGALQYLVKPFTFAGLRTRLEAYGALRRTLDTGGEAEQAEVDRIFGALASAGADAPSDLPKGHSPPPPTWSAESCARPKARSPPSRSPTARGSAARPPSATSSSSTAPAASPSPCATAKRAARNTVTPGALPPRADPGRPVGRSRSPAAPALHRTGPGQRADLGLRVPPLVRFLRRGRGAQPARQEAQRDGHDARVLEREELEVHTREQGFGAAGNHR